MSLSFVLPNSGLSFKQSYVHPVSPIKTRTNTIVSPRRVQVHMQRETSQTLEGKKPTRPCRVRAGTHKVCCLSGRTTFKYGNEGAAWRDLVKFLGGEKGAALAEVQGSQRFCSNLMGFLRQVNSPVHSAWSDSDGARKTTEWCWCQGKPGIQEGTWNLPSHLWVAVGSTHLGKGGWSQECSGRETGPRDPVQDTELLWACLPSSGK